MKKLFSLTLSAALVGGTVQQASAETVAVLKAATKQVAVQSSKGVSPASAGTPLTYGDHIVTGPEGRAVVSFAAGKCAGDHQVPPSALAALSESSCLDIVTGARAEVEWTSALIVGGMVIGGAVLAYGLSQSNSSPVSP